MSDDKHEGQLGAVYEAKSTGEVARLYDDWADTYDDEMAKVGYRHPTICLALLARHLPQGSHPILDAGVGTGVMGEWLQILDYPHIEGLDISTGMLARAERKNVYQKLHQLALGDSLPFDDDSFSGIVSAGVFTMGHVGTEGLAELIRICRPGGIIVLTIKDALWTSGFTDHVKRLETSSKLSLIEDTGPYVSMPGEAGTSPSRAVVLKIS